MIRIKPFTKREARALFPFPKGQPELEDMRYELPLDFVDFVEDDTGLLPSGQFQIVFLLENGAKLTVPINQYSLVELAHAIKKVFIRYHKLNNELYG